MSSLLDNHQRGKQGCPRRPTQEFTPGRNSAQQLERDPGDVVSECISVQGRHPRAPQALLKDQSQLCSHAGVGRKGGTTPPVAEVSSLQHSAVPGKQRSRALTRCAARGVLLASEYHLPLTPQRFGATGKFLHCLTPATTMQN